MILKGNKNGMFCIEYENGGFSLAIKCESYHTYVFTFISEDDENDVSTFQVMRLYQPAALGSFMWKWRYTECVMNENKKEVMHDGILSCNKELHIQLPANVMMLLPKDATILCYNKEAS